MRNSNANIIGLLDSMQTGEHSETVNEPWLAQDDDRKQPGTWQFWVAAHRFNNNYSVS